MPILDEIQPSLIAVWKSRVSGAVRVKRPEDADRIAENCAALEHSGDRYVSVWHETAAFYGTPCHCRRCNP